MILQVLYRVSQDDYNPGGGALHFFLVGMCRADFTRRSWNWNEGLKSRVIGTKKWENIGLRNENFG